MLEKNQIATENDSNDTPLNYHVWQRLSKVFSGLHISYSISCSWYDGLWGKIVGGQKLNLSWWGKLFDFTMYNIKILDTIKTRFV